MNYVLLKKCVKFLFFSFLYVLTSCDTVPEKEVVYKSETLQINKLSDGSYVHISYLQTDTFGKVPCNGMLFVDGKEALVFDTPTTNETSGELIAWIKEDLQCKINAIVLTHSHEDAMGGLEEFHAQDIASFANKTTVALAEQKGLIVPNYGIGNSYEHALGTKRVLSLFVGEGHTKDNIVGYFPEEGVLFGGCLVKSLGAGKGNLADANLEAWPETVQKIIDLMPKVHMVVPGHGDIGGKDLLLYTIELFN